LINLLPKYCERLSLGDHRLYMLEFDGEEVAKTETATDLDLDGGEIFDAKKNSKPTMQLVSENAKNYEFDDDLFVEE
jgi:hypothetical protein